MCWDNDLKVTIQTLRWAESFGPLPLKNTGSMFMKQRHTCHIILLTLLTTLSASLFAADKKDTPSPFTSERSRYAPLADTNNLRIIAFGAHPDDAEIKSAGCALLWGAKGHKVKMVSTTNGDIGHWKEGGGALAKRRTKEVQSAAEILGTEVQVLDNHDGELMPTLENRRTITRLIRDWKADLVLVHRPNDYHPDHRYTSILIQDAAFMVICPFFCPDVPHLKTNPVFLYYFDHFEKPNPFMPDVVVSIDSVIDKKIDALLKLESQFIEGCVMGDESMIPKTPEEWDAARTRVRAKFEERFAKVADKYRDKLIELYGKEKGSKIKYAEAFELCEYGRQPSKEELLKLFPFFD